MFEKYRKQSFSKCILSELDPGLQILVRGFGILNYDAVLCKKLEMIIVDACLVN